MRKYYKDEKNEMIFGVCAGISDMTNIDVSVIRIAWFLLSWFYGIGLFVYLLLALILPDKTEL